MNEDKKLVLVRAGLSLLVLIGFSFVVVGLFYFFPAQMGSMIFALLIGGIGAAVSFIQRFPTLGKVELNFLVSSWWAVLAPMLIGVVMGGLMYILFFAQILTGDGGGGLFTSNLFPNFRYPDNSDSSSLLDLRRVLTVRPNSFQDFGKLLVWCFLSGYSERFVPNLLENLERRGSPKDG